MSHLYLFQILEIHEKAVWVLFYGDNTEGQIFKTKLMKFDTFMVSYSFEENKATQKLRLRHKGILEALHEKAVQKMNVDSQHCEEHLPLMKNKGSRPFNSNFLH